MTRDYDGALYKPRSLEINLLKVFIRLIFTIAYWELRLEEIIQSLINEKPIRRSAMMEVKAGSYLPIIKNPAIRVVSDLFLILKVMRLLP
jgi:hypothetical protein